MAQGQRMSFKGVIIEESLADRSVLNDDVKIVATRTERVTTEHMTPWLKQWTRSLAFAATVFGGPRS